MAKKKHISTMSRGDFRSAIAILELPYPLSLLNDQDIANVAKRHNLPLSGAEMLDEAAERMNDAVYHYLIEAYIDVEICREWFAEVQAAADQLRCLFEEEPLVAKLLYGVGQARSWLSQSRPLRRTLQEWVSTMQRTRADLLTIQTSARYGLSALDALNTRNIPGDNGWPVSQEKKKGRKPNTAWHALAEEGYDVWRHLTNQEPTVVVDPIAIPTSRRSDAAMFVGALLDLAADRLAANNYPDSIHLQCKVEDLINYLENKNNTRRRKGSPT